MNNYPHPIALILIAGNSESENQQLHATLKAGEYVFATTTDLYDCLDLAECHHPKAVLVDFSSIEHNCLGIIQFLQFLQIPAIVLSDELQNNMIQYLSLAGVFATLKKTNNELELRQTLEMAAYPDSFDSENDSGKSRKIDLANLQRGKQTKLQDIVNKAIGSAISQMSEMIGCEIKYEVPSSRALSPLMLQKRLIETLGADLVAVAQLDFNGDLSGSAKLLFSREAAEKIVLNVNGGGDVESEEFKQDKADIMGEIGNLAINSIVGTFSNTLKYDIGYVVPHYVEGSALEIFSNVEFSPRSTIILFMSHLKLIDFHVEGDFILLFQARLLLDLLFRV